MAKGAKGHSFQHKKVTASGKLDADNDGMLGWFTSNQTDVINIILFINIFINIILTLYDYDILWL